MSVHFKDIKSDTELAEKLFRHLKEKGVERVTACVRVARFYKLKHAYENHRCVVCHGYMSEHGDA